MNATYDPPMVTPVEPGAVIRIGTGDTAWAYCVDEAGELRQMAFGPAAHTVTLDFPPVLYPRAIPAFGTEPHRRTALRVTHHDGTRSTRMTVVGVDRQSTEAGERVTILLRDADLGLELRQITEVFGSTDVVVQHLEIRNEEAGPITVWEAASASPIMAATEPRWTHLGGGWAGEWTPTEEPLTAGVKVIESTGAVRPHLQQMPAVLIAPDGPFDETSGTVLAAQIAWTSNICFEAEIHPNGNLRLLAGSSLRAGELVIAPGETMLMPEVVWAWSGTGLGPLSRRLHDYTRRHRVRDGHRDRAIVATNWDATFFDFDDQRLVTLIDDAAELGAELFLLDDGWFGTTHPRDDDTQGLGDWETDRRKLPRGLEPVIDAALDRGLRFGLWIEPEMVNPASELHGNHPEWVIGDPARPAPTLERNQLALDPLQPAVREFIVDTVDRLLAEHPRISYLKWDANRALVETGSTALDPTTQGRMFHELAEATWEVMATVAARHPEVEMMLCASGGGRSDLGALRWFHELWTSDNTDPMTRLRMQWCASWFLPANVLGAHVTRWGDEPVAFSAAVAMSARFGWDLDTGAASTAERTALRAAAERYRSIRPVVQHGELHRLWSPFGSDRSALAYTDRDRLRIVVFGYQLSDAAAGATSVGLPDGLFDPERSYRATRTVITDDFGPAELVEAGRVVAERLLEWPLGSRATAVVWEFTAD